MIASSVDISTNYEQVIMNSSENSKAMAVRYFDIFEYRIRCLVVLAYFIMKINDSFESDQFKYA